MSLKKIVSFFRNGFKNQKYLNKAFGKYLLLTNTASYGVLMISGDLIQQEIEFREGRSKKRYDWQRVGQMFIVGLSQGPIHHYFYGTMDKFLPKRNLKTVFSKIGIDQFVMSPFCIVEFFYCSGLLEGKSLNLCTNEIKSKFLQVYTMDWCVWPPVQFINFLLIPVKYQVLYISFITTLYNVYLSYIKHKEVNLSRNEKQDEVVVDLSINYKEFSGKDLEEDFYLFYLPH